MANRSSAIQDGEVAPPHEFPFAAFVNYQTPNMPAGYHWNCTGALVNANTLLFASH